MSEDQLAIISDIHGNLDALEVVLEDIKSKGITRICCLGDIIGYGPNPCECLDLVMNHCEFSLMGNHDFAALYEPTSFNASAESAAYWTRSQLENEADLDAAKKRWEFLGQLSVREKREAGLWVHASPRRPINEYIFPDDVMSSPHKMTMIFDCFDSRCFVGHTHVPGVFTDEPDFFTPPEIGGVYRFNTDEKCIINPGSVGQPRDRDPRSSYAVLHPDRVEFFRIAYDIQKVIDKIATHPELHEFLGQRLLEGR